MSDRSENMSTICRVCLKKCSESPLESVENAKCNNLLKKFTGTDFFPNEGQLYDMCENCSMELMVLVKFVKKFRSTTKKINKLANMRTEDSTKAKEDENYESSMETNSVMKEETKESENKEEDLSEYCRIAKAGELGLKKDMVQCLTCGLMLQNKSAFLVHYRKHSGEKPCVCGYCGRGFTQSGTLNEHIQRQHKGGKAAGYRYTCEACGKQFWRRGALTVHTRIHTKEKPYQCSYCPRAFAQFSEHLLHTRTHTGQRPHKCSLCPKTFISHSALRRHRTVHEEERKFSCHICETHLKSKESLKKHILVMHTAEKKNICDICGAKFSMKYNLKSHMRVRHSDKSGVCTVCNKSFSNLSKHMSIHSAETFLSCSICSKKFLRDKALELHMFKYHAATTPSFNCTFQDCTASFSKQCKLNFHVLKSHTHHTPHVCEMCSKGFYRLADLRKHIKSNHERQHSVVPEESNNHMNNYQNIVTSSTQINGLQ